MMHLIILYIIMESLEVSSLIIVEGSNDKIFIEHLIKLDTIKVKSIYNIPEVFDISGVDGLQKKLKDEKRDKYDNIGIIIDADREGIKSRINFINKSLQSVCDDVVLEKTNELKYSKKLDVNFACYIMNVNGYGELDTLLKHIKIKESTYADCLSSWIHCLKENNKEISEKDFDKLWVQFYIRFDSLPKKLRDNTHSNIEYSIKNNFYDFNSPLLDELKYFINLISS